MFSVIVRILGFVRICEVYRFIPLNEFRKRFVAGLRPFSIRYGIKAGETRHVRCILAGAVEQDEKRIFIFGIVAAGQVHDKCSFDAIHH